MNNECPFCRIVAGKAPASRVWEDETTLAFLDIHPRAPGHVLVIPKRHVPYYWEMEERDWLDLMRAVKTVTDTMRRTGAVSLIQVKIIGTDIPHVHVHLIPASLP